MRNQKNLQLVIPVSATNSKLQLVTDTYIQKDTDANEDDKSASSKYKEKQKDTTTNPVSFFKLFQFTSGFEKFFMWIGVLCSIVSGLMIPGNIYIFGNLVGSMVKGEISIIAGSENLTANVNATTEFVMDAVTEFAIGNSIIGAVLLVFTYISTVAFNYVALKQSFRIRTMYLRSVLHQDIAWYDLTNSGEVASRLTEDVIKYEEGVGEKVPMVIHNLSAFLSSMVLAFYTGWKLTLVCLACVPVMVVVLACLVRISSTLTRREVEVYAAAGSIAEEVLSSIRTVVAFAGQGKELLRYKDNLQMTYKNNLKKGLLSGIGLGMLWLSMYASYALSFWYGVTLILDERQLPIEEQTYNATSMIKKITSIKNTKQNKI